MHSPGFPNLLIKKPREVETVRHTTLYDVDTSSDAPESTNANQPPIPLAPGHLTFTNQHFYPLRGNKTPS